MTDSSEEELLSAYLDGEVSPAERLRAESLLATRPECRQYLEALQALRADLQSLPKAQLGASFAPSVLRRAEHEMLRPAATGAALAETSSGAPSMSWQRWRRPVLWSTLAAAASLLIMAFSPQRQEVALAPAPLPAGGELHAARPMAAPPAAVEAPADLDKSEPGLVIAVPHAGRPLREFLARTAEQAESPTVLLVVRCDVVPGSSGEQALRETLASQDIRWIDRPSFADEAVADASPAPRENAWYATDLPGDSSPQTVYAIGSADRLRAALAQLASNNAFGRLTVENVEVAPADLAAFAPTAVRRTGVDKQARYSGRGRDLDAAEGAGASPVRSDAPAVAQMRSEEGAGFAGERNVAGARLKTATAALPEPEQEALAVSVPWSDVTSALPALQTGADNFALKDDSSKVSAAPASPPTPASGKAEEAVQLGAEGPRQQTQTSKNVPARMRILFVLRNSATPASAPPPQE